MGERVTSVLIYLFLFCQGIYVDCRPSNSSEPCRRHPWVVDTTQDLFGHKVVEPAQLDIGLCSGSCPFPATGERTMHREVLDRFRNLYPEKIPVNWEYSQCHCNKFTPIELIVENEGKVERTNFSTLTVGTCGCS